jgi:hypothetical protein
MQEALGFVVIAVVGVVLVVGIILTVSARGSAYDQIGRGGLSLGDRETGPKSAAPPAPAGSRAEQEEEVRQMLSARNERRVRRGLAPLDVEAEAARLLGRVGAISSSFEDQSLVEEVRQLVEARNVRRVKQGRAPLDVETEVARQLRELGA